MNNFEKIFQILYLIYLLLSVATLTYSLCADMGSHCQDTGCRVHGGHCNSACVCVQRSSNTENFLRISL